MNVWLVLVNLEWPCFLVLKSTRIIKLSVFDVGQNRERERESRADATDSKEYPWYECIVEMYYII